MTDGKQDPGQVPGMRERVVLFADLVESVRLMQQQESLVIARWRRFCAEVREQLVPPLGGRVVRSAGDALLLTFDHCGQAAQAAFALHDRIALDAFDGTPALRLRVGIHRTDCLEDEHDAYGAGVNLTARLASLSAPGETVVSIEVRNSLRDGMQADFEDMGLRYLKHLQAPVRAFRAWRAGSRPQPRHAPQQDLRPMIAIVPFRSAAGDAAWDVLGYAAAEALGGALARHPRLRLLARASSGALQHERLDPSQLGQLHERYSIAYLLAGRLHERASKVHVQLELSTLPSGQVLWSEAAPLHVDALFNGASEWVARSCAQIGEAIAAHGQASVRRLPMDSLPAYSLYLGACTLMHSLLERDFMRAREALEHLAERHPRQPAPPAMLARWHITHGVQSWAGTQQAASGYPVARSLAEQALDLDPDQTDALCALALAAMNVDHDNARAQQLNEAALRIDPGSAIAWRQLSGVQALSGATGEAVESAERALQLSPLDPDLYLFECYCAVAALANGQPQRALAWSTRSLQRQVLHAPTHRFHIAALWQSGQTQRARDALMVFAQVCPEAFASGVWHMAGAPPWRAAYEDALHQAGLHRGH